MAIREALLALLEQGPASAYQLRQGFERATSDTWPLNMGQVSTTLQRLHRDGLIEQSNERPASSTGMTRKDVPAETGAATPARPAPAAQSTLTAQSAQSTPTLWRLTDAGHAEVTRWWSQPVLPEQRGRDELVMKLAFAAVTPGVDMARLVQRQRISMQRLLHDVTRARRATSREDLAARLVLDHRIFTTEAELRWLDALDEAQAARQASR